MDDKNKTIENRVTRCAGAKTASILPKKCKLQNTTPPKSATDLQKKVPVLFKPKKRHRPPKIADLAL